jgi:acetyltransferase-like isoleucine patch superfamily enzyme
MLRRETGDSLSVSRGDQYVPTASYRPAGMAGEQTIDAGTLESRQMAEGVRRAVRCTERLNALPYDDREGIAAAWSKLTGQPVDPTFHLIPPVCSDCGLNLRIGRNVFINQGCRLDDIGGIHLGDDVLLAPGVRLISSGHPLDPAIRRSQITTAPIRIGRGVWIAAGAMVLQGVAVGDDAVVAAGAVVTKDVPPRTLVAGVPARVVRSL